MSLIFFNLGKWDESLCAVAACDPCLPRCGANYPPSDRQVCECPSCQLHFLESWYESHYYFCYIYLYQYLWSRSQCLDWGQPKVRSSWPYLFPAPMAGHQSYKSWFLIETGFASQTGSFSYMIQGKNSNAAVRLRVSSSTMIFIFRPSFKQFLIVFSSR